MAGETQILPVARTQAPPSALAETWDSLKQNRGAVAGLVVLIVIVLIAIFADFLTPYAATGPEAASHQSLLPPAWMEGGTWAHPLGTDATDGRDLLTRVLHGARYSLGIGLSVMLVSVLLGVILGLVAAFRGGIVDIILMRVMDLIMSIPDLVLAMVVVSILRPSLVNTVIAVTIVFLPRYVRIVRAAALSELSKEYVTAAKVVGVGPLRLMFKTVLPNCAAPLIVQATLGVSDAILEAAALGFLNLGAQAPTPEWGAMLADARSQLTTTPWLADVPGVAILITVVAINLFGDGLRDALDPKLKRG